MQLFAYYLPQYVPSGSTETSASTYPIAASGNLVGNYPKPFVWFPEREPDPTLLDFLTPMFSSTDAARALFPVVSIFVSDSAGGMGLFYLELSGNEEAIDRLRLIAEANQDDEQTVKAFTQHLSQRTVEELTATNDVETPLSLLAAALPEGPDDDAWDDREAWTVADDVSAAMRPEASLQHQRDRTLTQASSDAAAVVAYAAATRGSKQAAPQRSGRPYCTHCNRAGHVVESCTPASR